MRACVGDDELQGYLERRIGPASRDQLDAHFADCASCRGLLAAAVRALPDDEPATPVTAPLDPLAAGARRELPTVPYSAYAIAGEIARGGLGRVLRARDQRLGRDVALKVLLPAAAGSEQRFVAEAHITAGLEHPSIVPVHEAGRWPSGEPFYAMKLVSGRTLTELCRHARSLGERLALLPSALAVAEAVAYAHSCGVIHRDLKPANVLVGEFGETVVIDWGLAKRLADDSDARPDLAITGATRIGAVLGTPPYMPPEQARGEPVDERADVYALGAILYQVLCGAAPYAEVGDDDVVAAVIERPPRPLEERTVGVPRDLLAIVRKAMARDPARRYPTARELAADLAHFQTGQLVSAREYSRWALLVRWLGRHRLPVVVAAAAVAVIVAFAAVSLGRIVHARSVAESARAAEEHARRQAEGRQHELVLLQARAIVDRDPTRALAWLKQVPASAPGWAEGRAVAIDAVSRGFARHVWRVESKHTIVRFAPDGGWVVSSGGEAMRVADPRGGAGHPLALPATGTYGIDFAADGTMAASGDDGTIALFAPGSLAGNGPAPRLLRAGGAPGARTYVAISPDGRRVAASTDQSGDVSVWDVATGAVRTFAGPKDGTRHIAFAPDGRTVATVSIDRVLRLRDLDSGLVRELVGAEVASHLVFTAGGARVVTSELSGIREWTLADGSSRRLPFPSQRYIAVAASPDGATIAAAGFEGPIHLLDVASGEVTTLAGHEALVVGLDFSPDGHLLASVAMDLTVRLWQFPAHRDRILGSVPGTASRPVFTPDGAMVAAGGGDGGVRLFPLAGGRPVVLAGHTGPVFDVDAAPDGRTLASQSKDQTVRLWDLDRRAGRVVAQTSSWVDFGRLAFSPDGRRLAASLDLQTLAVIDVASGRRLCTFGGHGFNLAHAFVGDDAIAFTGDHHVVLGELTGCTARTLYDHDEGKSAYAIVASADGRLIASASDDATVGLYDLAAGRGRRLRGHDSDVTTLAFAAGGRWLVTGSGDRTLRVWDTASPDAAPRILRGHDTLIPAVLASPDGRVLASTGLEPIIHLWDLSSGAGTVLRGHRDRVTGIRFSPDGRWLASGALDGTVRLWPADPQQGIPIAPVELKAWLEQATSARIDADNRAISP